MVDVPSFQFDDFNAGMSALNAGMAYSHLMADYGNIAGIDPSIPAALFSGGVGIITAGVAVKGDYPGRLRDPMRWGRDVAVDAYVERRFADQAADAVADPDADAVEEFFADELPADVELDKVAEPMRSEAADTLVDTFADSPVTVRRHLDDYVDRALVSAYLTADRPLDELPGVSSVTLDADAIDRERIDAAYEAVFDDMAMVDAYLAEHDADRLSAAKTELESVLLEYIDGVDMGEATVADAVYREAVERAVPSFIGNEDVSLLYRGEDIHPYSIHKELLDDFASFLSAYGSDIGEEVNDALAADPDTATLAELEQDLLHEADIVPTRLDGEEREEFLALRDGTNRNVLNRYRPTAAVETLDRNWGAANMPYEVYELDDPDELYAAAKDVGTCRRGEEHRDYYEQIAADPETLVFGVRREDVQHWVGFSRNYLLEVPAEDASALGIDTMELVYKDGSAGGAPHGACDFETFGDVPIVLGLAGMRYALDNDIDYVAVGSGEGRVSGGPDDQYVGEAFGPGDMYKGTSGTQLWLRKDDPVPDGHSIHGSPGYGFSLDLRGGDYVFPDQKKEHDLLLEPVRHKPLP